MTIIATPKATDANSYVDITFATSYFTTKFGAEAWDTFTTAVKERLLVSATNRLEVFLYGGSKTVRTQALVWPRKWLQDVDGYTVDENTIPQNMLKAACEMAYWIWTEEDRLLTDTDLQQVDSFKAGPLDLKVNQKAIIIPPIVEQLIKAIGPGVLLGTDASPVAVRICR